MKKRMFKKGKTEKILDFQASNEKNEKYYQKNYKKKRKNERIIVF